MKVLIAGGSGLIGQRLMDLMNNEEVYITSRSKEGDHIIRWNVKQKDMPTDLQFDVVINLTGAGIVDKPWKKTYRQEIINSRIDSIETLDRHFQREDYTPNVFINASAVGIYGDGGDYTFSEEDRARKKDFLVEVCEKWENGVDEMLTKPEHTYKLRIGVVLSTEGGAYPKLSQGKQVGVVPHLGSGDQFISWVHIDDLCAMIVHLIQQKPKSGSYNASAPTPVTNKSLAQIIARQRGLGMSPPVPEFMVRLLLGQRAITVLGSTRVSAEKIRSTGFNFKYPSAEEAVTDLEGQ